MFQDKYAWNRALVFNEYLCIAVPNFIVVVLNSAFILVSSFIMQININIKQKGGKKIQGGEKMERAGGC